jgi:predicted alpha-1,6-mannanase (GH76 family)
MPDADRDNVVRLSRRGFLKTTAAAGMGVAAAGVLATPGGAFAAASPGKVAGSDPLLEVAAEGMTVLQTFYNKSNGQWNTDGWWNAANALMAVIDYSRCTGATLYLGDIPQTFVVAQESNAGFVDTAYDDDGWWALAWVNAYDLTGEAQYLEMAKSLFSVMTEGWTDTCGGGMTWETTNDYKETIANELFLALATSLHLRTPGDRGPGSYLDWAEKEWAWFESSGLINTQRLVNDGLTSTCENNGETTWTYNQGVILRGLAEMHDITRDPKYLHVAEEIADAALAILTVTIDLDGRSARILDEPYSASDPTSDPGQDPNVTQFKGIFMRNFYELYRRLPKPAYRRFILDNAQSIIANDVSDGQFGYLWQGPQDGLPTAYYSSVQTSALEALIAAISVRYPYHRPRPTGPAYPAGTNLVANSSGGSGTTGWYMAYGGEAAALTATTYQGSPALQWTVTGSSQEDWVYTYPDVTDGDTYTFAIELAGTGTVILDTWVGDSDFISLPVDLTADYQTASLTVTIPAGASTGQSGGAPQLQVATVGTSDVSVYMRNASTVAVTSKL